MAATGNDAEIRRCGNLFSASNSATTGNEALLTLIEVSGVRIQRIVSSAYASPPGFWYDQSEPEWVALLSGEATLMFEGEEGGRQLKAGDWIHIPAHHRHRIEWTSQMPPAVWIAVHFPND